MGELFREYVRAFGDARLLLGSLIGVVGVLALVNYQPETPILTSIVHYWTHYSHVFWSWVGSFFSIEIAARLPVLLTMGVVGIAIYLRGMLGSVIDLYHLSWPAVWVHGVVTLVAVIFVMEGGMYGHDNAPPISLGDGWINVVLLLLSLLGSIYGPVTYPRAMFALLLITFFLVGLDAAWPHIEEFLNNMPAPPQS